MCPATNAIEYVELCQFPRCPLSVTKRAPYPQQMRATDDIRAVMDDIGIESANIFGVSEGGSMACLFAATCPQRVNSLLVWGAQARWIASPDHPWGQTQEEHDRMVAMIDDDWPSFEYITGPGAGVGKDADPAFIESLSRYMRAAANPSAVHAYEQMNGQLDTRPILPSIQAPTLP